MKSAESMTLLTIHVVARWNKNFYHSKPCRAIELHQQNRFCCINVGSETQFPMRGNFKYHLNET